MLALSVPKCAAVLVDFPQEEPFWTLFPFVMILTHSTQLGSGSFSHFFVSRFVLLDC